ncbi:hypothetical protein WN55_02912 [Dufourea novaeangliae]|uniref:Uncharacterized protein n=1 Tax=Dufourea novaeangliae TaxID=178035 RepID=A0A154PK82_DUFNO|nr:hypothetical protein WN55_02912 [Dufourea novaeangliae]
MNDNENLSSQNFGSFVPVDCSINFPSNLLCKHVNNVWPQHILLKDISCVPYNVCA